MGIIIRNALTEVHHSIGIVDYYRGSLRYVYSIIITKILYIQPDLAL